ncbi:hypothetical protein PQG83_09635 [Candidatus Nitrospira neomarina]|uniref:Uncharacterized protein n=1 Tax=Candidatus Nitrospira neomarina TaxID=3020899 RepID=A0AA96GPG9_9BACT|nr:hypothetical protein [Candidatus Nitrospira neomarina]WNM63995.1 hypothetical protein PQG83_09635 [Candidatus Nitrospira neomarina]
MDAWVQQGPAASSPTIQKSSTISEGTILTGVYQRLREALYHLAELEGVGNAKGGASWMKPTLGAAGRANGGEPLRAKASWSDSWNGNTVCTT